MTRDLIPFTQLTRFGVPAFQVARRALTLGEVTLVVGTTLNPELIPATIRRTRLRQFYEQRLLEPVIAPKDTRQAHRHAKPLLSPSPFASSVSVSRPVPAVAVIPSVDIPVSDSSTPYTPTRTIPPRKGAR